MQPVSSDKHPVWLHSQLPHGLCWRPEPCGRCHQEWRGVRWQSGFHLRSDQLYGRCYNDGLQLRLDKRSKRIQRARHRAVSDWGQAVLH